MNSLIRIFHILLILRKYRIDQYFCQTKGIKSFRWFKWLLFWVKDGAKGESEAIRIRKALEELGPIWIKLGQMMSIQDDFFSLEITQELRLLQDHVTPFSDSVAMQVLQDQLGMNPYQIFDQISKEPIATASIAQCYTATLNLDKLEILRQKLKAHNGIASLQLPSLDDFNLEQVLYKQNKLTQLDASGSVNASANTSSTANSTESVSANANQYSYSDNVDFAQTGNFSSNQENSDSKQGLFNITEEWHNEPQFTQAPQTTAQPSVTAEQQQTITVTDSSDIDLDNSSENSSDSSSNNNSANISNNSSNSKFNTNSTSTSIFTNTDINTNTTNILPKQVDVVIKILRPGVEKSIKREINLIRSLFSFITMNFDHENRLRGTELVDELEDNFKLELDLTTEASNGQTLRDHWVNSHELYIPKIFISGTQLLVIERLYLTPFKEIEAIKLTQPELVNTKLLAIRGVEIFFTQLLNYNFFHADMHPGNIFVDLTNPQDPTYACIDFGIVGSLSSLDTKYLVAILIAFFQKDYRRIAELHIANGWVRGKVDVNEFERKIRLNLEPIMEQSLSKIRFSLVLKNLFGVAREFNMVVQPQLMLIQKTLVYVEAMGRALYPELNLWDTAKPILEKWFAQEYSVSSQTKKLVKTLPEFINLMSHMPNDMYRLFDNHSFINNRLKQMNRRIMRQGKIILATILGLFGLLFIGMGMMSLGLSLSWWIGLFFIIVGLFLALGGLVFLLVR